jgi:hypothetical protein
MLAIIDGDVLAYQACKTRFKPDEAVNLILNDKGNLVKASKEYTMAEDAEYLGQSWDNFQRQAKDLLDCVFATDYLMAVKSQHNFRNLLYPEYKMNRHKDPRQSNFFVPVLRGMAVDEGLAVEAVNMEADDLMRMWAEQARLAEIPYVICTIDKDLKCIPGLYYNMKTNMIEEITEEFALRFFYEQLLKGDGVDNIPGIPGVGPVKAERLLVDCSTEFDMQEVVVEQYMSFYPTDWYNYLQSNGAMLYLKKHEDDFFSCRSWEIVQTVLSMDSSISESLAAQGEAEKLAAPTKTATLPDAGASHGASIAAPPIAAPAATLQATVGKATGMSLKIG